MPTIEFCSTETDKLGFMGSYGTRFISELTKICAAHDCDFITANTNGFVFVRLRSALTAAERGTLLLDLEEALKRDVDKGLSVWHEPLGDKNTLRHLRGVTITIRKDGS